MVEAHARILLLLTELLRGLVINWLSILNWGLLDRSLLLNGSMTMAASTAHNSSDSLVSDLRPSTHGHTSSEGAAETTSADSAAHATADLRSSTW